MDFLINLNLLWFYLSLYFKKVKLDFGKNSDILRLKDDHVGRVDDDFTLIN